MCVCVVVVVLVLVVCFCLFMFFESFAATGGGVIEWTCRVSFVCHVTESRFREVVWRPVRRGGMGGGGGYFVFSRHLIK